MSEDQTTTDTTAANSEGKTFDLATTNGAIVALRQLLAAPGWAKKVKQARRAARFVKRLPKLREPKGVEEEALEEWIALSHPITVDEADRDLAKSCIKQAVENGSLFNTETALVLLDEFGVVED